MTDNTKQAALGSNITKVEDLGNGTFRVHREEIVSGADLAMMAGRIKAALEGSDQAVGNAGQTGNEGTVSETQAASAKASGRKGASSKGAKAATSEGTAKATSAKGQKAAGRSRGTGAAAKTNARTAAGSESTGTGKQKRLAARSTRSDDRIEMPNLFGEGTGAPDASAPAAQDTKKPGRKAGRPKASSASGKASKATAGKASSAKGAAEAGDAAPAKRTRGKASKKQDPILAEAGLKAGDATPAKGKAGKPRKAKDAPGKAKAAPGRSAKGKAKTATKASAAPVTKARGEGRRNPLPEIPQGAQTNSPAEVKDAVVAILKSAGGPVPRRQIYIQLHDKGVYVPGQDPIENLATMLYKDNEHRFENLKGQGFVLKA